MKYSHAKTVAEQLDGRSAHRYSADFSGPRAVIRTKFTYMYCIDYWPYQS